jgi:hypothetical protein
VVHIKARNCHFEYLGDVLWIVNLMDDGVNVMIADVFHYFFLNSYGYLISPIVMVILHTWMEPSFFFGEGVDIIIKK